MDKIILLAIFTSTVQIEIMLVCLEDPGVKLIT